MRYWARVSGYLYQLILLLAVLILLNNNNNNNDNNNNRGASGGLSVASTNTDYYHPGLNLGVGI